MKVRDEVCGMRIRAEDAARHIEFHGNNYYFCSDRCRRKFEEHPGWYVPVVDDQDNGGGSHVPTRG